MCASSWPCPGSDCTPVAPPPGGVFFCAVRSGWYDGGMIARSRDQWLFLIRESLLGNLEGDGELFLRVPRDGCLAWLRKESGKDYGDDIDAWLEWINEAMDGDGGADR